MARPQSESDFPGKGRWLDRNQSPSTAKRRKQVGVSITACRGPLRPASGGPSCGVQSLNISPTEREICFCCEPGGCSADEAAAGWAPRCVQRDETPASLGTNCGRLLVLFIHNGEWYFKFKKNCILYFIISIELSSTILASIGCDQVKRVTTVDAQHTVLTLVY